jgi:hypothetical protein
MYTFVNIVVGAITWGNTVECDNYVTRLQQAADALSLENRKLRKVSVRTVYWILFISAHYQIHFTVHAILLIFLQSLLHLLNTTGAQ